MKWSYALWTLLIGCLVPFQAIINARMAQHLGHPVHSAIINFIAGLVFLFLALFLGSIGWPELRKMASIPPYLYLGGAIGAGFVISGIFVVPKLGTLAFLGLIVCGQLVMSVLIDHFGVLDVPAFTLSPARILGIGLLAAGAWLALRPS